MDAKLDGSHPEEAGNWHTGQLGSTQAFTLAAGNPSSGGGGTTTSGGGTITTTTVTTPSCGSPNSHTLAQIGSLSVSSADNFKEFKALTWVYTVCNVSGVPASIQRFEIAVRGPAGDALHVPCNNGVGVALQPGQEFTCTAYLSTGYGSSGTFTYWSDWLGYDGNWHTGELSGKQQMSIYPP